MDIRKSIDTFLRRHLFGERARPVHLLKLRHAAVNKRGKPVDDFPIGSDMTIDSLGGLIDEILARAQQDCDGRGNIQRYTLVAYERGQTEAVGTVPFRLRAEEADWEEGGDGDEEPSLAGLVKQQMRHNEALARMVIQGSGAMMSTMRAHMDMLGRENTKLMEQRRGMIEAHEASLSLQAERDIELLQASSNEERKNAAFQKAMMLAPLLINKLAGQQVMKADDPMTMMLRDFVDSLTPDQFQKLASGLTSEQQIVIMSLVKEVKKLPAPGSNGASS